ncbi:HyaD/HybD family hydrogenase maturation endopeptidase [Halarcobacter bivalviorum]|uniref:HyaD/HybD family hydrogenase maturation endopeptidase n=1 Tax=Halarcobacter bivalviorum TaxID=663364 RepID=UPI00100AED8E|nr:HyaD/HybD family hydrogenase maturation endopeptidase [Halarcobacter bivalviorum]RXK08158.1 HyaD/HybD family hydrogenase maturation endopeptidase [Halarcobacter bivalviorum]
MNILILGIGNILFQDEGIGAHFIHYLDEKYEFEAKESTVSIVDGGTLAQRLIPEIVKYDELIVIDCIDADNSKPGDVYFFDYHKAPSFINWQGSAHEVEMLQTLNMIDMNKDLPHTNVLGVIPKRVADDTTFELSKEIIDAVKLMEEVIIKHLKKLDIEMKIKREVTIEEIAQISFKRDIINGPKI